MIKRNSIKGFYSGGRKFVGKAKGLGGENTLFYGKVRYHWYLIKVFRY